MTLISFHFESAHVRLLNAKASAGAYVFVLLSAAMDYSQSVGKRYLCNESKLSIAVEQKQPIRIDLCQTLSKPTC